MAFFARRKYFFTIHDQVPKRNWSKADCTQDGSHGRLHEARPPEDCVDDYLLDGLEDVLDEVRVGGRGEKVEHLQLKGQYQPVATQVGFARLNSKYFSLVVYFSHCVLTLLAVLSERKFIYMVPTLFR